jgi:homoserine dehydrogenase
MADQKISLESIVQHRPRSDAAAASLNGAQPVILVTHRTTEQAVDSALKGIAGDGHLVSAPQRIRIEK